MKSVLIILLLCMSIAVLATDTETSSSEASSSDQTTSSESEEESSQSDTSTSTDSDAEASTEESSDSSEQETESESSASDAESSSSDVSESENESENEEYTPEFDDEYYYFLGFRCGSFDGRCRTKEKKYCKNPLRSMYKKSWKELQSALKKWRGYRKKRDRHCRKNRAKRCRKYTNLARTVLNSIARLAKQECYHRERWLGAQWGANKSRCYNYPWHYKLGPDIAIKNPTPHTWKKCLTILEADNLNYFTPVEAGDKVVNLEYSYTTPNGAEHEGRIEVTIR